MLDVRNTGGDSPRSFPSRPPKQFSYWSPPRLPVAVSLHYTRMSDAYSECVKGSLKLKGVSSGGVKKY